MNAIRQNRNNVTIRQLLRVIVILMNCVQLLVYIAVTEPQLTE